MSTLRPVYWQVRNSAGLPTAPTMVSAVMTLSPPGEALIRPGLLAVGHVDPAGHEVMTDSAILVAHDREFAAFGRRQRDDMLVTRMDLNIDVGRLQRKSMLPVERRKMNAVADVLFQFQDRPPLPQPAEEVHVGSGGRLDYRQPLLLPHLVFLGEVFDALLVVRRRDAVCLLVQVLLADEMPGNHEAEHEQAPQERNDDPDQLDLFDRLVPPDSFFGRRDGHGDPPFLKSLGERNGGYLHDAPEDVQDGRDRYAEEQQQERIVQDPLHDRNAFRLVGSPWRQHDHPRLRFARKLTDPIEIDLIKIKGAFVCTEVLVLGHEAKSHAEVGFQLGCDRGRKRSRSNTCARGGGRPNAGGRHRTTFNGAARADARLRRRGSSSPSWPPSASSWPRFGCRRKFGMACCTEEIVHR